jgi:DNA-binding GntR family transcriptional regulator
MIIFEEAGVQDIWSIVRRHSGHLDRLRRLNLPSVGTARVIVQHDAIIDAIARRDPFGAIQAMKTHLSGTLAMIGDIIRRYPDFVFEEASTY